MTQCEQESLEAPADLNDCKLAALIPVPHVHRAPDEFDDLPDELPDASAQ